MRGYRQPVTSGTFLGRLKRDKRGNTLAMMAAFLVPVCALAGSAIDMARMYVVKVRLQQACDAGALAGRKFMTGNATTLDGTATTRAKTFFANNFPSGFMGTAAFTATTAPYPFVPTKTTDQQVAGSATATVPMTIMKMFGQPDQTLTVTCEARFDVADTDIVFVLDTTGSMACKPEDNDTVCSASLDDAVTYTRPSSNTNGVAGYAGSTGYRVPEKMNGSTNISRIQALRTAVVDFYSTIQGNIDPTTNVRYGFVTYSSMVNAGKAVLDISSNYIIGGSGSGSWTYQSRIVNADYVISNGPWADTSPNKNETNCLATAPVRTPSTAKTYASGGTATQTEYRYNTNNNANKCQVRTNTLGPQWKYQPQSWPVGPYVAGGSIGDPTSVTGGTTRWMGCLEERTTTAGTTTFDSDNLPNDLNPDQPSTINDDARWRPYWPAVEYIRPTYNVYPTSNGESDSYQNYMDPDRLLLGKNGCAKPIQRLKVMSSTDVNNFVNAADFVAIGGTYHDIGMIWGLRPDLADRHLRGRYGRLAGPPATQADHRVHDRWCDGAVGRCVQHVRRRAARPPRGQWRPYDRRCPSELSQRALPGGMHEGKAMNIDVWTIAIAPDDDDNLTACATIASQAFHTTSGTGLSDAFKQIAKQVAMLRISK